MGQTIGQYQVATFATPVNGQPADADQVRGNDNAVRGSINSHDADPGIHWQESTLALRPIAGSSGRKWWTTDDNRVYRDTGSAWAEIAYMPISGTLTPSVAITAPGVAFTASNGQVALTASSTSGRIDLTASGGSGSISFYTGVGAQIRWNVNASGHFLANTDNFVNIGAAGATRPANVYVASSVVVPTVQANTIESTSAASILFRVNGNSRWSVDSAMLGPTADNTYNLGSPTFQVGSVYIGTALFNAGTQILTGRKTGWTAATGTATRTTFATGSVTLSVLAEHVKALIDDLISHGLIGT